MMRVSENAGPRLRTRSAAPHNECLPQAPWAATGSALGNQAVLRMLSFPANGGETLQRKCACGGDESGECADCKRKGEGSLQRAGGRSSSGTAPPIVHQVLRSPGHPLDPSARAYFEPRFGRDFSGVRVHTGADASASARAVQALAYTVGNHVVFGGNRYALAGAAGKRLIAHELAHVVQQSQMPQPARSDLEIGPADSPFEQAADRAADQVLSGGNVAAGNAPGVLQRAVDDTAPASQANPSAQNPPAGPATATDESADYRELTEQEKAAITITGQAATTPDGNPLGPADPAHRGCLGTTFFFAKGPGVNDATGAHGESRVTAQLHQPPGEAADCSCGCGLFRQFIRGFARFGSPTSAKVSPLVIDSCAPNRITISENTFTEEFVNCVTGGAPIGPGCSRTQNDFPGVDLPNHTFVQLHLVLRYQMWDQCKGRSLGIADHVLDISGSRAPRRIAFT